MQRNLLCILTMSFLINATIFSASIPYFSSLSSEQKEKLKNGAKMGCMCVGGMIVVGGASYGCWRLAKKWYHDYRENLQRDIDARQALNQAEYKEQQKKEFAKALGEKDFEKLNTQLISQKIIPDKQDLPRHGNMLHEIIAGWEPNVHQDVIRTINHIAVVYNDKIKAYFDETDAYPRERKPAEIIFDLAVKQDNSGLQLLAELYNILVDMGVNDIEKSHAAIVLKHAHSDKYITFVNYVRKTGRVI